MHTLNAPFEGELLLRKMLNGRGDIQGQFCARSLTYGNIRRNV
jgi:hypothetical protein